MADTAAFDVEVGEERADGGVPVSVGRGVGRSPGWPGTRGRSRRGRRRRRARDLAGALGGLSFRLAAFENGATAPLPSKEIVNGTLLLNSPAGS